MNKKKRLKILHTESSLGWGGQEIRILNEAQGLIALGHELHIICSERSRIYHEAQVRGIPVTALPVARKSFSALYALWNWLRINPVDIINTHSSTDAWLVAIARLALSPKIAVVRTRHVSALIKPTFATRWLYRSGCDFVVTTGERLRKHVVECTGLSDNKVKSVPTGIDIELFCAGDKFFVRKMCGLPLDAYIIGIVSTLRSWKGHHYLLEAFNHLPINNAVLLIVGDGPGDALLRQKIKDLKIESRVFMVGNQDDVVPWLQALDLFVLPSYANEGVPQSLMQAMMVGVPVISTPVGSIDELIEHNVNGVLVEPKSIDALQLAIQQAHDQNASFQKMAQRAQQVVKERFSDKSMNQSMQKVFQALVTQQ